MQCGHLGELEARREQMIHSSSSSGSSSNIDNDKSSSDDSDDSDFDIKGRFLRPPPDRQGSLEASFLGQNPGGTRTRKPGAGRKRDAQLEASVASITPSTSSKKNKTTAASTRAKKSDNKSSANARSQPVQVDRDDGSADEDDDKPAHHHLTQHSQQQTYQHLPPQQPQPQPMALYGTNTTHMYPDTGSQPGVFPVYPSSSAYMTGFVYPPIQQAFQPYAAAPHTASGTYASNSSDWPFMRSINVNTTPFGIMSGVQMMQPAYPVHEYPTRQTDVSEGDDAQPPAQKQARVSAKSKSLPKTKDTPAKSQPESERKRKKKAASSGNT
eukprot:m.136358 g.136358  ORF g.136358 m.136358 type:complete len:326 (-) comp15872_c2_seq4:245-1222(-)